MRRSLFYERIILLRSSVAGMNAVKGNLFIERQEQEPKDRRSEWRKLKERSNKTLGKSLKEIIMPIELL